MTTHELNAEESNKAAVRRLYDECLNQGRLEAADELIAPTYAGQGLETGTGPEAFKKSVTRLRTAFPDIHFTIHEVIAENDRVALRWTWEGTHLGRFLHLAPTNKRGNQEALVMYRFEHGKVVELKLQLDRLGLLQQLGVIPEMSGAPGAGQPAAS